ncbi:MAG: tRNA (N6-isopentenyl adenosine(37)-C2)-methylthiotransferase MiaB [Clostridia bacterium]|nr:tRNA (N6-isopentenyl adenosine(37)-C2)-methylthiotransferase MiaB [Clostridia bacterium]
MQDKLKRTLPPCDGRRRASAMRSVLAWNQIHETETGEPRRVYMLTFGCQQNEADSEKLCGMAEAMGYAVTDRQEDADLILVNTCAIREHAENKALAAVGSFKELKKVRPDLIIGVCGCMTSQDHRRETIKQSYPYVTFVLGTSSLHQFPAVLWDCIDRRRRMMLPEHPDDVSGGIAEGIPTHRASDYRAWVSIMYGCNNLCSYCIVPYVRGRERSRNRQDIIDEVRELVAKGYKDITLLGQNVNSYGKGLAEPCSFADLLEALDAIPGDWWLRFMTSHPKDADRRLIDVMAKGTHIVPTFHLPLQSGSDPILKRMNRHYDRQSYLDTVAYMKQRLPRLTLTSDIIVGFPGETDEDFEATLDTLRTVEYDMLFAFIYSPRVGTPAASMEQVDDAVKKARYARLLKVQEDISARRSASLEGQTLKVLCDGPSRTDPSVFTGRTPGNRSVFFTGTPGMTGRFLSVHIDRTEPYALWGTVIQ